MDGVNGARAKLGDLTVLAHPVLLVNELSFAVGGKATPITNTDKVSSEAFQLELRCKLLIGMDPCLTQVDDICLEESGVDLEVLHVWAQPCDVQRRNPGLASHVLVPVSRVFVEGSVRFKLFCVISHEFQTNEIF